ncbi:MAG: LSM domain-containing protein [Candidatus Hermodarchaeota archaeon]
MQKPLDILEQSLDKNILLKLRGNKELRGILKSFDNHLNLVLEGAELISIENDEEGQEVKQVEKLGKILLRGDNVILISPP